MLSSSSHGNSSQLVSVHSSCPLLLSLFPLPPAPALSSCLIALRAPMPRFRTKVPDLALRFSTFWPQMNSPVLSHFPFFQPFALCTIFYSPAPWYILYPPTPKLLFSPIWKTFILLPPTLLLFETTVKPLIFMMFLSTANIYWLYLYKTLYWGFGREESIGESQCLLSQSCKKIIIITSHR